MTDAKIIKALECCAKLNHNGWSENMKICQEECPYKANCYDEKKNINMISDALDLINRLQAENESEVSLRQQWQEKCKELLAEKQHIKAEAIKEFAERLKEKQQTFTGDEYVYKFIYLIEIDNLVKEMVGES